jgi:hypothetical protein
MTQRERRMLGIVRSFGGVLLLLELPGCRVVGGIFKAGVWAGVLAVVFVVAVFAGMLRWIGRRV